MYILHPCLCSREARWHWRVQTISGNEIRAIARFGETVFDQNGEMSFRSNGQTYLPRRDTSVNRVIPKEHGPSVYKHTCAQSAQTHSAASYSRTRRNKRFSLHAGIGPKRQESFVPERTNDSARPIVRVRPAEETRPG